MDEAILEIVRNWLMRASHDLRSARILAAVENPLLDTAIYHCQQTAEKAVKAWLQSRDEPFAKTHDVEDLIAQAATSLPGFKQFAAAAEILTPYASAFRYPGGADEPMPTRKEFDEALHHAQAIYDFVVQVLPPEARP